MTSFYTNYEPIYFDRMEEIKKIKGITLKKFKNCVYFGTMNAGRKDGLGILHYYSGKIFEGVFYQDYKV